MRLTMNEKKAVTTEVAKRYQNPLKNRRVRYWMSLLPLWGIITPMQGSKGRDTMTSGLSICRNNCFVEQKNYVNFFQPVMKLKEKTRIGSKVKKRYDTAKTPYQRILQSEHIHGTIKDRLKRQYEKFNPAELKRNIMELATSKVNTFIIFMRQLRSISFRFLHETIGFFVKK